MLYITVQLLRRTYVAATQKLPTMTQSTDAPTEDTTMSDASSKYPNKSSDTVSSTATKTCIKIAFKLQKTESTDVSAKHREILIAITKSDKAAVVLDKDGHRLAVSAETPFDTRFSYETLPRKHYQLVCVTHSITTRVPFSNLKHDIRNVIATSRATVTVNTWNTLDVRDAGWLLQMNPRTHNRNNIAQRLRQAIQQISTKPLPKFHLYTKTISNSKPSDINRISVSVIVIECESSSLIALRELLHTVYASNNSDLPGKFIPMNFPHIQSAHEYTRIIKNQQEYLENHRNITVTNVTFDDLKKTINHNNDNITILSALKQSNTITWISPNQSSSDTHKLNISTTAASYLATFNTIKSIILSNIPKSSTNITPNSNNPTIAPPIMSPITRNYLAALTSSLPSSPSTSSPSTSRSHSHTITATNISSITSPTTSPQSNIQLQNIKEHISRSIQNLRKEFQSLQTEIHNEIQKLRTSTPTVANDQSIVSNELNASISSIKNEFESFRTQIHKEMKQHLQTTISIAIKTTTENLTKMITTEVNRALQKQLNALSPRNRKPKRSRAPNLDDSISQRLFSARSYEESDNDDPYEVSNALFEANMTDSPYNSDHSDNENVPPSHP